MIILHLVRLSFLLSFKRAFRGVMGSMFSFWRFRASSHI